MSTRKMRIVENLILVAFPVALFAGCAGSDIKPTPNENSVAGYSDSYSSYENPLPEKDLMDISMAYTMDQQAVEPVTIETDSGIAGSDSAPYTPYSETSNIGTESSDTDTVDSNMLVKTQDMIGENENTLQLPDHNIIHFDTDKHQLLDEQRQELQHHADYLLANPQLMLVINGHADIRGTENYNQALSEKRAQAVYQLMVELGVPEKQMIKKGFGELKPLHDDNNFAENRRVELDYQNPVMLSGR